MDLLRAELYKIFGELTDEQLIKVIKHPPAVLTITCTANGAIYLGLAGTMSKALAQEMLLQAFKVIHEQEGPDVQDPAD